MLKYFLFRNLLNFPLEYLKYTRNIKESVLGQRPSLEIQIHTYAMSIYRIRLYIFYIYRSHKQLVSHAGTAGRSIMGSGEGGGLGRQEGCHVVARLTSALTSSRIIFGSRHKPKLNTHVLVWPPPSPHIPHYPTSIPRLCRTFH